MSRRCSGSSACWAPHRTRGCALLQRVSGRAQKRRPHLGVIMGPVSDRATVRVLTQRYQWRRAEGRARVGIIMGSDSDLATMRAAAEALEGLGVPAEVTIVSAHRTPERMVAYARGAHTRGLQARRRPRAAGVLSLWRPLFDWDPGWAAPRNNMTGVVAALGRPFARPLWGAESSAPEHSQPSLTSLERRPCSGSAQGRQQAQQLATLAPVHAPARLCMDAPAGGCACHGLLPCALWPTPLCSLNPPLLCPRSLSRAPAARRTCPAWSPR